MTHILQINTSLFGAQGQSSRLAAEFAATLAGATGARHVVRDLARDPVPHLTAERFAAFGTPAAERSLEQQREVAQSDALIDELARADVLVLGLPMYNFGVPSTPKAYLDHIARAGVTFKYTETGPVGLVEGKKAFVVAATGGVHAGTPRDFVAPYLKTFLGFIGISDVEVIQAEGLSMQERKEASIGEALNEIERI